MRILLKSIKLLSTTLILVALAGCATVPYKPPAIPKRISGIYHEVQKGETLWRISKVYNADMKEVVRLNRLPDASRISAGQLIFIPYAKERLSSSRVYVKEESFIWPIKGEVISFFGSIKEGVRNKGIDIKAKEGTKVVASRSGKVNFCDDKVKGFGKTIIVEHGDGYSTVYAYNSDILVNVGDDIKKGNVIARVGRSGRAETGSLHFEIRKQHRPENPFYYLP